MNQTSQVSPAVETAKYLQERDQERGIFEVQGVRVRLTTVSATLIDEVVGRVDDPVVPMWHNPDKDRDEPNTNDPLYLKAVKDAERKRGIAAMDALVMFGIELIDGVPETGNWLRKLQTMERRKHIDLSDYDLEDEIDREFLYKRYILADGTMLTKISEFSGISGEDVDRAERSFQSD